jgi:adenosylcobinamide-phosphate synthase
VILLGAAAPAVLVAALLIDAIVGDPDGLWRRLPHPVVLIGKLVSALEARLNDGGAAPETRRRRGVAAAAAIVAVPALLAAAVEAALLALPAPLGLAGVAVVAATLLAQRSLDRHVAAVGDALAREGLPGGRRAVAHIVGRDPGALDEAGVTRAAIETLAENFSDAVVAPAFWFALLGLPGLVAYKAANTADSMIGHKNERYLAFGWAAARLDDLLNLVPARLAGLLIAFAAPAEGGRADAAIATMRADAPRHPSPNAGWPEAAMAAGLGVALLGPIAYGGTVSEKPWLNAAGRPPAAADIGRALAVYRVACALHLALYAMLAAAVALA